MVNVFKNLYCLISSPQLNETAISDMKDEMALVKVRAEALIKESQKYEASFTPDGYRLVSDIKYLSNHIMQMIDRGKAYLHESDLYAAKEIIADAEKQKLRLMDKCDRVTAILRQINRQRIAG